MQLYYQAPQSVHTRLTPARLTAIVTAILETPPFKMVERLMGEEAQRRDPHGREGRPVTNRASAAEAESRLAAMRQAEAFAQYSAAARRQAVIAEQYAALQRTCDTAASETKLLRQGLAELQRAESDKRRRKQIAELHSLHPHAIDVQELENRCLYSAGSEMTDAEFDQHCESVQRYAAKIPAASSPQADHRRRLYDCSVEQVRYEAAISAAAVEYHAAALASGHNPSYEQCVAAVKAKRLVA